MDIRKIQAIDPPGCTCADCASAANIPLDSDSISEVFKAIMNEDMKPPQNNLRDATLVIYRTVKGTVRMVTDSELLSGSDYIVIPAEGYNPPEEDPKNGWPFIDVSAIKNEHVDMQEHLINSLIAGSRSTNPSYSTFIAYRSPYGHTGLVELPQSDSAEVTILPYSEE